MIVTEEGGIVRMQLSSAPFDLLTVGTVAVPILDIGGGAKFLIADVSVELVSAVGIPDQNASLQILRNGGLRWGPPLIYPASASSLVGALTRIATAMPAVDPAAPAPCFSVRVVSPWAAGTVTEATGRFVIGGSYQP